MKTRILKIEFNHVGRNAGCQCDRCGQHITNIWTVRFGNGQTINFGIDCFEQVYKHGGLSAYGLKEFKKLIKRIKIHKEGYNKWLILTEEQARADAAKVNVALDIDTDDKYNPWYGKTFEEYKDWMLNEWYGERFREDERELEKFRKIGFEI